MIGLYMKSLLQRGLQGDLARRARIAGDRSLTSPPNDPARLWERQDVLYTADSLGINLPWLDLHNGSDFKLAHNWLNASYDCTLVEADLAEIEAFGIRRIRCFCLMEWVFNFRDNAFRLNPENARHLDDFLDRAELHGMQVITVMSDGNYQSGARDDHFRWNLIQGAEGRQIYADAYAEYVNRFGHHRNILMWEMHNEPYGNLTWMPGPRALGVTQEQIHAYLRLAYTSLKPIAGDIPVGFSDLEEKEQEK
jgi:hypothetical protein